MAKIYSIESNEIKHLDTLLKDNSKIVIDFNATWCGPCKMLNPVLDELSQEYNIIKIDIDKNPDIASEYEIMSVPTLVYMKDQQIIDKEPGYKSKEYIESKLKDL